MCGALYLQHALGCFSFYFSVPAGCCRAKQMEGAVLAKASDGYNWIHLDPISVENQLNPKQKELQEF